MLLLAPLAGAQQSFFPFGIDQDRLSGAPDFSFLNRPIEPADRLFARDGHFFRVGRDLLPHTADDDRVRLFGMNLAFGANFPAGPDAPRIARRLRRLGVNLVRLHHMDTQPDANPENAGSILTTGPYPTLNPVAVERLRAFLDELGAEGIYVNLNLHVGYQFRPGVDQVPALPPGVAFPTQSKPLRVFHPLLVERQSEFTRLLIEALRLKDDPVLAMVEISNEASMLHAWQTGGLDRYLLGEYGDELRRQWNLHLGAIYCATGSLRSAWGGGEPDGPEMLDRQWRIEVHSPAQASFAMVSEGETAVARVEVAQGGAPVILKQVGFSIRTDRVYLAEVELRADVPAGASRGVYWDIKQDISPWRTETGRTVAITSQWQKFTMALRPSFAMDGIGRFGLSVENVGATVYVRNWSLRATGRRGLAPDESLETTGVSLVAENEVSTDERTNDYLLFLAETDRRYLAAMLNAVRETTDRWVPVAGTQMGYGGLLNVDSHQQLDYDDNHFYVDHYNFPNTAWDGRDWRIRDTSALGSGLTAFQNMAAARQAGRPYTVSEFNQPWPNTYAAEGDPLLAAFAAFQDWDSILHFAYSHGRNWDDGAPNGFNINGDWTKFPNIGQSAWMFRSGAIQAGRSAIELPVPQSLRLRAGREKQTSSPAAFLGATLGLNAANAFVHPLRLSAQSGPVPAAATETPSPPYRSDTGEMTYDPERRLFLIHAPAAAGVFGFISQKVRAGAVEVELAPGARGFAAILATALDGRRIEDSARLQVSTPGHTLRTQPGATPERPQALVNYGSTLPAAADWWTLEREPAFSNRPSGNLNGGLRPIWMERVESFMTLSTTAVRLAVYPLDGAGARLEPLAVSDVERVAGGFRVHLQGPAARLSPWYEFVLER